MGMAIANLRPACLRVLKLTAPGDEISRRHLDLLVHTGLGVLNKAADVPVGDVALHHDPAERIFAADDRIAAGKLKSGQLAERHAAADRGRDQNVAELFHLVSIVFAQAHKDREPALAFQHLGRLVAADGDFRRFQHVGNI